MQINKNQIVIELAENELRYQIIKTKKAEANRATALFCYVKYESMANLDRLFIELTKIVPKQTSFNIYIQPSDIQMRTITIPVTNLTLKEMELYIESSLYKLFQIKAEYLYYDFIFNRHKQTLTLAVCERKLIEDWQQLLTRHNCCLHYLGCIHNQQQFNFLPWRKEKVYKQMIYCCAFLTLYFFCVIGFISYCFSAKQNTLTELMQIIAKQEHTKSLLNNHVSLLNNGKSLREITSILYFLANNLPNSLWIESLNYSLSKIVINGKGTSDSDIVLFNHLLSQQNFILRHKLTSLALIDKDWQFDVEIELHDK